MFETHLRRTTATTLPFLIVAALLAGACGGDSTGPDDPNDPEIPELPPIAPGTLVFQDDIDSENGGNGMSNYTGWTKWTVVSGCVDLHGPGATNPLPGNGVYLDLDGSCGDAGTMESKNSFSLAAGDYVLEFVMAGNNQASQSDEVVISIGGSLNRTVTLPWDAPFTVRSYPFTVASSTNAKIRLEHAGGDDQGILVDAVRLRKD